MDYPVTSSFNALPITDSVNGLPYNQFGQKPTLQQIKPKASDFPFGVKHQLRAQAATLNDFFDARHSGDAAAEIYAIALSWLVPLQTRAQCRSPVKDCENGVVLIHSLFVVRRRENPTYSLGIRERI